MEPYKIFISGYAKLPTGTTAEELYKVIALGIILDKNTGEILDADCSVVTSVAKEHVRELLVGKNLKNIEAIEEEFKNRYYGSVKKSLISSVRKCYTKYIQILENNDIEE
ncbi:DUF3870 domain-containing protein [Alkaliphilus peptidifermentans]|uniref:DUF3870 domain-containing protein n=1 Tax=Alkaliphilus peptidifermentans DSM 18978 TaxID=1120976 RepID=A0A1G5KGV7_9FIRM|nr:DUF3870 domain-containing protein [Alkaliphilus peptidifermentans]SCY99797.1 protein of unknown function [Alkaliphilus peptidifermentans DSM 18978]